MELSNKVIEKFKFMNLPNKYYLVRMEGIKDKFTYKAKVQDYLDSTPNVKGLYLHGPLGHGKSAIAAIVLKTYAYKGIFGHWLNYKDLVNIQYNNVKFDQDTLLIDRIRECSVLAVDEFDVPPDPKQGGRGVDIFESILRHRDQNGLPTIITSNLKPNQETIDKIPFLAGLLSVASDCTTSINVKGEKRRPI